MDSANASSQYCIYLRKSRADMEAEAHGEGETLARHERILLDLSNRLNLNITQIYREVVSGETIAGRPMMQKLLSEVGAGLWTGVLVVEVERLARGDTMDQGLVAQTFKYSDTKIITPLRTYDPANEFDEEYFEFGLFMSRREYKTINRRLQRGKFSSAKEGKFLGGSPPYGYDRVKIPQSKGWTLCPNAFADNVKTMFRLYTSGEKLPDGSFQQYTLSELCERLEELGILSPGGLKKWDAQYLSHVLSNPTYVGKLRWNYISGQKQMIDGVVTIKRRKSASEDVILVDGLHPAIISEELFDKAQAKLAIGRSPAVNRTHELKNPLSGILFCGFCGKSIIRNRTTKQGDLLVCLTKSCCNVGSYSYIVEEKLLDILKKWIDETEIKKMEKTLDMKIQEKQTIIENDQKALDTLNAQLSRVYDLMEQGVYDKNVFLERTRNLNQRIEDVNNHIADMSNEMEQGIEALENQRALIPTVRKLVEEYNELSITEKNRRLKQILERVEYTKTEKGKRSEFKLILHPRKQTVTALYQR